MKRNYEIMAKNLRFNISAEWLMNYGDIAKLKFLNKCIHNKSEKRTFPSDVNWYKAYIQKFYDDEYFNYLYFTWKRTGDELMKPSLDHIIPLSKGGTHELSNLQFISCMENYCKHDILNWDYVKRNLNYYLK